MGVTGFAWLAVRLDSAVLPSGVAWRHIMGAGLIGGVGFTVALFITGLAFTENVLVEVAKVAVLCASFIAALSGYLSNPRLRTPDVRPGVKASEGGVGF